MTFRKEGKKKDASNSEAVFSVNGLVEAEIACLWTSLKLESTKALIVIAE